MVLILIVAVRRWRSGCAVVSTGYVSKSIRSSAVREYEQTHRHDQCDQHPQRYGLVDPRTRRWLARKDIAQWDNCEEHRGEPPNESWQEILPAQHHRDGHQ